MTGWRFVFVAAALFNLAVGLPAVVAPQLAVSSTAVTDLLAVRLLGWMIAVFGIGYTLVALAPLRHRGIVVLGIIGKAGVIGLTWWLAARGEAALATAQLALGDLLFVVLFSLFLYRTRGQPKA